MKNSKSLVLGTALALVLSLAVPASAESNRDWPRWMANYYQAPQPELVVPAVFALGRSGYFEQPGHSAIAVGFLSSVFSQNPDKVAGWMHAFQELPVTHQRLTAAALWYSGLPGNDRKLRALARQSSPELRAEIDQLLARGVVPVNETPVLSVSSLNLQWGAFLASGEQQHIVTSLAALGSADAALSSIVRSSLAQKAAGHQRVYEICQAQLASQPAGVGDQMRTALADEMPRR